MNRLGFTRQPDRWVLSLWLLCLVLAPRYRLAAVLALVLLVLMLLGTFLAVRREVRRARGE